MNVGLKMQVGFISKSQEYLETIVQIMQVSDEFGQSANDQ